MQESHQYECGAGLDAGTVSPMEFYYSTRAENLASKALALSCGLAYQYLEQKTDQCGGKTYELEIYKKNLKCTGSEIE